MIYKTLDDVKRVIKLAKPVSVVMQFWGSYQEGLQYSEWLELKRQEYLTIWPETEAIPVMLDDGVTQVVETTLVDYSDNPEWVSFDDWMNEREALTGTRTVIAEDGTETIETYEYEGGLIREFVADPLLYQPFEESDLYRDFKKHVGLEYGGVLVPLGKDTQDTATALSVAFQNGLTETNFHFENGNKLHLTLETFPAFSAWVMQNRAEMFT